MTGSRVDYILYGMKTARLQKILDAQLPPKPAPDGIHSRSEDKVDSTDEPLLTVRSLDSNSPEDIVQKVFDVEAEAISAVSTWSCEMCTYFNDAEEPVCSMCGSSRPGESPTAAAIPAAVALWFCPLCTLLNPLTSSR